MLEFFSYGCEMIDLSQVLIVMKLVIHEMLDFFLFLLYYLLEGRFLRVLLVMSNKVILRTVTYSNFFVCDVFFFFSLWGCLCANLGCHGWSFRWFIKFWTPFLLLYSYDFVRKHTERIESNTMLDFICMRKAFIILCK